MKIIGGGNTRHPYVIAESFTFGNMSGHRGFISLLSHFHLL